MAEDSTRIIIGLDLILRNLDKTLAGLSKVEGQLKSIADIRLGGGTANFDKAAAAAQKLQLQQQKLAVQSVELANRQVAAQLAADRLALAQLRLESATNRAAQAEQKASTAVTAQARKAAQDVAAINAETVRQASEQQDLRIKAAKTLADVQTREAQRGADAFAGGLGTERIAAEKSAQQLEAFGNSLRSLGQGLTSVGFALSAVITVPLVALGKASLDAAVTMDSLKRGLTAITGSAAEAETQLKRLTEIAKLPGIGFQEAIQGSIRLQAVGFSAKDAEKALREFSNAIALTGGGRDELARVTTQLGQLAAKGKVLSQDLRPIIEAAPAVGTALKQAFGTVNADDIANLTGSSEEFFNVLVKQLELLPRASAGAKNAFENFQDSVFRAAAVIGNTLIPILTKLIDFALPIVETLANAFAKLPFPIRAVIVVLSGVTAALGPLLIIVGQLIVGVGRLSVAFGQMGVQASAAAAGLEAEAVAAGEAAVATGALSGVLKGFGGPIGILLTGVAALAGAYLLLGDATEKVTEIDVESEAARRNRIKSLEDEVKFLDGLVSAGKVQADQEKRLADIRQSADDVTKGRLTLLDNEIDKVKALVAAKKEQLATDQQASQAIAVQAGQNVLTAITTQIKAQNDLTDAKKRFQGAEIEAATQSNLFGARQLQVADIEAVRKQASLDAAKALEKQKAAQEEIGKQARVFIELARATGLSTDALLALARQGGLTADEQHVLAGAIADAAAAMRDATVANDAYLKSLAAADKQLVDAGDAAEAEEKRRQKLIASSGVLAREASKSFEDAKKFFDAFRRANPDLEAALRRQAEVTGKSVQELIDESIRSSKESGSALRNAQEQLQKSLLDVTKAGAEKEAAAIQASNDALLRANEASFKLQLISYDQYLRTRAELTKANIQTEIDAQQVAIAGAKRLQASLLRSAAQPGIPPAEVLKRQAQANEALKTAITAEQKMIDLKAKQGIVDQQLGIDLATAAKQQEDDIRKLSIEYAQLQGHIEDAFKAQVTERFRIQLEALGKAQEFIAQRLADSTLKLAVEERRELEQAQRRNQLEIDRIGAIQRIQDALDVLKTSEQFATDAKEKQKQLEEDLAFQVEFRGKKEIDAINARLAGEEQLKQRLILSRDIVQDEIDRLKGLGQDVPKELAKFVDGINRSIQGLGELSFSDQFRLIQTEFEKLDNARIAKIDDVERAVRHRDISELEGMIQVRKANGQYVADLEAQVAILEEVAKKSNDPRLQQQAENARQTAEDVRAATTEFASFNKQLRATSIDALQASFADFFSSLSDRTKTAREHLLDALQAFENRILDMVSQNLSKKLLESIFGTEGDQQNAVGGVIGAIKKFLHLGGGGGGSTAGDVVGHVGDAVGHGAADAAAATAAATELTAGATAAATAMSTGGTVAGTAMTTGAASFAAEIAAAGAAFAAAITAAGAAFAAAVAAGSAAQAAGGIGSSLGSAFAAAGDFISPQPQGRLIRVAEAGFPEAILTTDPRHATRQASILREFLTRTKGLFGRVPSFAEGAFVTPHQAEMSMLSSLSGRPTISPQAAAAVNQSNRGRNLRFVFVDDQRDVRNWMDSAEGEQVFVQKLHRNRPQIKRLAN